ncbi:MAG TPA: SAM-dependent methyltransferase [Actinomycetota bacterium]|nr:SAM-dependent methyltransferase [Actinomycetota bacterium]
MTAGVRDRIVERIRESGPIGFDAFMELALYDEEGYYARPPIGVSGDFVTSPHVHRWFAYGLTLALAQLHHALGAPRPIRLLELGAGDGTLAGQVLEILAEAGPIEYTAVERSAAGGAALSRLGVRALRLFETVGPVDDALIFANELLDNLPFRRIRRRADGSLVDVCVGVDRDRLVEVEQPTDIGIGVDGLAMGSETIVPTGALALVDALADRMRRAYALVIDYSAERGREVHGYRDRRVIADVLDHPGTTDITAGVDFDLVEARARERGLEVLGRVTQRDALLALGFASWTERERDDRSAAGDASSARSWAARSRASLLVDEQGLGAHRWLLLATPGLGAPVWLEVARERAAE